MIPFLQARWFTAVPAGRIIDLLVAHSMEGPEGDQSAESCARYFHDHPGVDSRGRPSFPSAHVCGDNNSRVRCVLDRDVANAAPGANHNGLHYEFPGTATQTRDQWLDPYGDGALDQGAAQFAEWVTSYDVPVRFVDHHELLAGQVAGIRVRGITTHAEITKAFGKSTHWDPGPGFPMDELLARIRARLAPAPPSQEDDMALARTFIKRDGPDPRVYLTDGLVKRRILTWDKAVQLHQDLGGDGDPSVQVWDAGSVNDLVTIGDDPTAS